MNNKDLTKSASLSKRESDTQEKLKMKLEKSLHKRNMIMNGVEEKDCRCVISTIDASFCNKHEKEYQKELKRMKMDNFTIKQFIQQIRADEREKTLDEFLKFAQDEFKSKEIQEDFKKTMKPFFKKFEDAVRKDQREKDERSFSKEKASGKDEFLRRIAQLKDSCFDRMKEIDKPPYNMTREGEEWIRVEKQRLMTIIGTYEQVEKEASLMHVSSQEKCISKIKQKIEKLEVFRFHFWYSKDDAKILTLKELEEWNKKKQELLDEVKR